MRWRVRRIVGFAVGAIVVFVMAVTALSLLTMLLWNALVPALFNGPTVTFGQAIGLLLLSHILLRGASPWRGGGWGRERWRRRFEEKLRAMTPEERERFEQEWGRRCGWSSAPDAERKPDAGTT